MKWLWLVANLFCCGATIYSMSRGKEFIASLLALMTLWAYRKIVKYDPSDLD